MEIRSKTYEPFCSVGALIGNRWKGGAAMITRENPKDTIKITAMDVYRGFILGLMGVFYGFLVFLIFL